MGKRSSLLMISLGFYLGAFAQKNQMGISYFGEQGLNPGFAVEHRSVIGQVSVPAAKTWKSDFIVSSRIGMFFVRRYSTNFFTGQFVGYRLRRYRTIDKYYSIQVDLGLGPYVFFPKGEIIRESPGGGFERFSDQIFTYFIGGSLQFSKSISLLDLECFLGLDYLAERHSGGTGFIHHPSIRIGALKSL